VTELAEMADLTDKLLCNLIGIVLPMPIIGPFQMELLTG
jgi:hypothetical protein